MRRKAAGPPRGGGARPAGGAPLRGPSPAGCGGRLRTDAAPPAGCGDRLRTDAAEPARVARVHRLPLPAKNFISRPASRSRRRFLEADRRHGAHRLAVQDVALSRRKQGFDSPWARHFRYKTGVRYQTGDAAGSLPPIGCRATMRPPHRGQTGRSACRRRCRTDAAWIVTESRWPQSVMLQLVSGALPSFDSCITQ